MNQSSARGESYFLAQVVPLLLTVVIFGLLTLGLLGQILLLNRFTAVDIIRQIRWSDVLVGMTIYLKTAVDFAIFIGNLMSQFPGWKNRVSIEIGTALGNAAGTMIVLTIWNFFRNVEWLLAIMIFIAALVLFRLAEDGLEHARAGDSKSSSWFYIMVEYFSKILYRINVVSHIFLRFIIPNISMKADKKNLTFWGLFSFSFTVPFVLGLDDFAGYVPLFNVVNVFGFAIGVFAGHMVLNALLFISPDRTIKAVKNPLIAFLGSIAFVLLAVWGLVEVYKILFVH